MLESQFQYMRLQSDEKLEALKHEDIVKFLTRIHEYHSDDLTKSSQDLLQKMKTFQRPRNLIFWHDGSTLSSHRYILIMVATLYDDAVFMTNEEYFQLTGISTEIQPIIEKPYLYILTRCPSTEQQLIYSEKCLTDMISLKDSLTTKDGIVIFDVARAFKGDHPATQYEAGQQKCGNYACHACSTDSNCHKKYSYAFKCKYLSLKDRITKVLHTLSSRNRLRAHNQIHLYSELNLPDIIEELHERNNKTPAKTKQQYHDVLKVEMHGIQQLPSLFYTVPFKTLNEINLQHYEILVNELLHNVSNHIKNIQQEIPYHVDKAIKKKVQDVIISSFNNKDAKNSADYRRNLLMITNWFQQELPNHFTTQILMTLSEIQELLYLPDNKRNPANILRSIITTYKHAMFLKI